MVARAPSWKRRMPLKLTVSGRPKRSFRYWGNMVWNELVNGRRRRFSQLRAAQPRGPSVAMCTASGAAASMCRPTLTGVHRARRISG